MQKMILQKITDALKVLPFVRAIVLGGSRATGTAGSGSDIDVGVYYDSSESLDYDALNAIARTLDDERRENLICHEGGWGPWVNCGGWLTIDGCPADIILRDWQRVAGVLQSSEQGQYSCHYQPGHPHAFVDVMYRGELASCQVLYARDDDFLTAKQRAEIYPPALKAALIGFFLFESDFSCGLAEKYHVNNDACYLTGNVFRSVSAMNQALFALNEEWLLNEKKAVLRIEAFPVRPNGYGQKIDIILFLIVSDPKGAAKALRSLRTEVAALCEQAVQ